MAGQGVVLGGRFRLVRPIGDGGMGSVWQAHDELLALPVAVKIVPASREDELYARFHQEARIIRQFSHKNIVGVLDAGEIAGEGLLFMAMELLHGSPLSNHLRPGDPLAPAEVIPVLVEVCRGLEAAHRAGVIHRDIKPENIFLALVPGEGVVPKILDFGLSTTGDPRTHTRITADGQVLGTPTYMSPEQAAARPRVTPATDVWSMGVILYEAVAGKLPFQGASITALLDEIVRGEPAAVPAAIDRHTCAVLTRCLQKDPAHRYPDATALRADLERTLAALQRQPGEAGGPASRADELPRARSALVIAPLAAALCLLAAYAVLGHAGHGDRPARAETGLARAAARVRAAVVD